MRMLAAGVMALLLASPCLAQTTPSPKDEARIVVEGTTPDVKNLPVTTQTTTFSEDKAASAVGMSEARRFLRCAHQIDGKLLHNIVDHGGRDTKSRWALDRLIRQRSACHGSMYADPQPQAPFYGMCNPIGALCQSVFDRGVLFEYALGNFAPDLQLTRSDLQRREVRQRFLQHDLPKVRLRYPEDQRYLDIVSCVVQLRPEESLELIRLPEKSPKEDRLRALLVASVPACFGNAKKVTLDPNQFRVYVAEAIYNWAVAVKGVDSLVPGRS